MFCEVPGASGTIDDPHQTNQHAGDDQRNDGHYDILERAEPIRPVEREEKDEDEPNNDGENRNYNRHGRHEFPHFRGGLAPPEACTSHARSETRAVLNPDAFARGSGSLASVGSGC